MNSSGRSLVHVCMYVWNLVELCSDCQVDASVILARYVRHKVV